MSAGTERGSLTPEVSAQAAQRLEDAQARRLHRHSVVLQAGEVVLAGSFIRPIDAVERDTIVADYGEFRSVACHFG